MYFNLKEPNSKKETLIIFRYFISKFEGRFVYSTGLHIDPNDWDTKTKLPKLKRGRGDLAIINRKLQEYILFFDRTTNTLDLNKEHLSKSILKLKFDENFKPISTVIVKLNYFTEFIDDFLIKAPNLINRITKKKYNLTKIKHYKKTCNRLKEYEFYRSQRIRIGDFSLEVYDDFVRYLIDNKKYSVNYTGDLIKNVKVLLKKADELNYEVHQDYKNNSFSVLREKSISIALSEDEIQQIFDFDFSESDKLQNCRDLAIIGLWTGLRVSDFLSLKEIKLEDKFITVQPKKTKDSSGIKVVIPLHHHIKEIIQKRGMPRLISDVNFNLYIKEVCKEVGLTEMIKGSLFDSKLNRKKLGTYPKYKLVSSHTCRRSFATNLYKMNFPTLSIMKITGHTSERTFLTYIKVTPTEHAEKLLEHWESYYKNK